MLKDTLALLAKMKSEDGNKAHIVAIDKAITAEEASETAQGVIKTEHATFKVTHDAVGDKNVGEMIGFIDAMTEAGLDTAAKVIDLKSKADGDKATLAERDAEKIKMQEIIDSGKKGIEDSAIETAKTLLLAETKTALVGSIGVPDAFNAVLDVIMATGKVTRDANDSTAILYDGKPVLDAVEDWGKKYGSAFKEAPEGSNNGVGGGGDQPSKNNGSNIFDSIDKQFSN